LSGGQQQRVALARAIVIKPQVLLLDEPLSNLDANLREEMRFEIRRLHDEFRITTVYVTHDQAEAMVTSDRIAVMNLGRIEQVDDPHTLYTRPKTRFVAGFIGRTNFLEGTRRGGDIVFDRFAVPASALESPDRAPQERLDRSPQESLVRSPQESLDRSPQESLVRSPPESQNGASDKITFSVRPQSMRLHRMESDAASGRIGVAVKIAERAYLGEFWDYMVVPREGSLRLRVTAPPPDVYAVGEAAWLELDPKQMAPIA
jgi:iron(III) transport system ATP-binding protein